MKKIVWTSLAIILVVLCFVFNKYDLAISIELTKLYNGFYEFFDDFGELPIYFGPILFGLTFYQLTNKKLHKLLCASITFISYLISSVKIIHNMKYSFGLVNIAVSLLCAFVLLVITSYLFSKIKKENLAKFKDLAILGLIVSVASFAFTEVIKYTWGRVRFRDLSPDYHEFTNLFHINGLNGNKSFPSGHTNAGTSILLIALLVPRFTNKKWIKYSVTGLCFAYIAVLAFSRIVCSAHYASDVLVGFVVGFTTICLTYKYLKRKGVINVASNKC